MTISFWGGNHPRQAEIEALQKLVPDSGSAENPNIELVRGVCNLFHEYCNNGNLNAAEWQFSECVCDYGEIYRVCPDCHGCGTIEEDECDCDDGETTETCYDCDDGRILEALKLTSGFSQMLETLSGSGINVEGVEKLILDEALYYNYEYAQAELDIYNRMVEDVLNFVKENNG